MSTKLNKEAVGKFIIIKDLAFSDFFKDGNNNIVLFDSFEDAANTCGMYEFENVLILEVKYNFIEPEINNLKK